MKNWMKERVNENWIRGKKVNRKRKKERKKERKKKK